MTTYTYTGSPDDDNISLGELIKVSPYSSSFQIEGKGGDDYFRAHGQANVTLIGDIGNDTAHIDWLEGGSTITFSGGLGNDQIGIGYDEDDNGLMLRQAEDPVFTRYKDGTMLHLKDTVEGFNATVYIEDSVEFIVFYDELRSDTTYATRDLASGITKKYFGTATSPIDWWYDENILEVKARSTTASTSTDLSQYNIINGTNKRDKLTGTNGDDAIYGNKGPDKINGKGGDDIIDPGESTNMAYQKIKGGAGSDTFIIKDNYFAYIKDFDIIEDRLDLSGFTGVISSNTQGRSTYIYEEYFAVAKLKGKFDLSEANIV